VPLFNYLGGQEVSHQTSEQYKEKIIELMELDGFILVGSSSSTAMTQDLVFRKPITEGDIEIFVETKFDDVSLSDKSFLTELGRYFILYNAKKDRPFDFYMFLRKCRNWNKWRQIFSSQSYLEETSAKLYHDILEKSELNEDELIRLRNTNFEDFERFLSDTYVNQISYDRLLMEIEKKSKNSPSLSGYEFYLQEFEPFRSRENILCNFSEFITFPNDIYMYKLKKNVTIDDIYDKFPSYLPICIRYDILYSLFTLDDLLLQFVETPGYEVYNFKKLYDENKIDKRTVQILLKKSILNAAVIKGCDYIRYKGDNLYFKYENYQVERQYVDGKLVGRFFKDASSPFVRHNAIKLEVRAYSSIFYLIMAPISLFSDIEGELITGPDVAKLHLLFTPNRFDNNSSVKGDLKWWHKYLITNDFLREIKLSDLVTTTIGYRPPKNSTERDNQVIHRKLEGLLDL